MRNISTDGLAKLASKLGTEPIFIISVDWCADGAPLSYADRDLPGIQGKIIEVGDLDNVADVSDSNSSQEISITLADADGSIKAIMDTHDIHQVDAWVYQYFDGLALSDKFLLFRGKVSSPIQWNEGDRTIKFSIINQIEDQEIGFSAEQGQFPFIPDDLCGKAWPIVFGRVFDLPAVQVVKAIVGKTLCGVSAIGGAGLHNAAPLGGNLAGLGMSLAQMNEAANMALLGYDAWKGVRDKDGNTPRADQFFDQYNNLLSQMANSVGSYFEQQACALAQRQAAVADNGPSCNPLRVLGGEDFPQDVTIDLNINGAIFTGHFINDLFYIDKTQVPVYLETAAQAAADSISRRQCKQPQPPAFFNNSIDVPCGHGDVGAKGGPCVITRSGFIIGDDEASQPTGGQIAQQFWADSGSQVSINSDQQITYIVSITPGTVLNVKAYKRVTGGPSDSPTGANTLVDVPPEYYQIQTVNYGTVTAVQVVTPKALSTILDQYGVSQGWGDDLYITFESTIGPNMVDIMKYIIGNWTNGLGATANLTWDDTSFDTVRAQVDPFPMNFVILDQKNTIDWLKDIAFQGTCALTLTDGVFYLKYLPAEPDSDDTITVTDILHQSTVVELTTTEDIITKMFINWKLSWANGNGEEPLVMILRHNVAQYGTKQQNYEFFCYNQPDIILKKATFWLIRNSNTWKKISFKTPLSKLNLETFDTVTLDLPGYVASGPVKAIVSKASYNSLDQTVELECKTPVLSGTAAAYKFFWPSSLTVTDTWPTPDEIADGSAGSGGSIPGGAGGDLDIGYTGSIGLPGLPIRWRDEFDPAVQYIVNDAVLYNGFSWVCLSTTLGNYPPDATYWQKITSSQGHGGTVFVGGPNVVFFGNSDYGDRNPGDVGFQAQPLTPNSVFGLTNNSPKPNLDLSLNYVSGIALPIVPTFSASGITIDIRNTTVIDSTDPGKSALLSSLIRKISVDGAIYLDAGASVTDANGDPIPPDKNTPPAPARWGITDGVNDSNFDFQFDSDGKVWGAGTAFLKDTTPKDSK